MDLAIDLLDMCMYPFRMIDNPIIIVPMAFLTVLGVVGSFITDKKIKSRRW